MLLLSCLLSVRSASILVVFFVLIVFSLIIASGFGFLMLHFICFHRHLGVFAYGLCKKQDPTTSQS